MSSNRILHLTKYNSSRPYAEVNIVSWEYCGSGFAYINVLTLSTVSLVKIFLLSQFQLRKLSPREVNNLLKVTQIVGSQSGF